MATTLDEVRVDAGASVGAIYHHFPSKQALLEAVANEALEIYQQAFAAELERHTEASHGIRAAVAFHVDWCASHPAHARLLMSERPSGAEELNRHFFKGIVAWLRPHVHYGVLRDLGFAASNALWMGPVMELTRHWLSGAVPRPTREQIELLAEAAWQSLRAPG